jgi:16S rRNA (cytidine1402-2'-O)-methyltransferase
MESALYVVATPIGNLGDMVPRAVEILQSVQLIAAEDTRHSARLLAHFSIATPTISYHDHSGEAAIRRVADCIESGGAVALISDAGTPLISDPGYRLLQTAHQRGWRVIPIPGPSALIAALSVAGLPTDRFRFEGFLPARSGARRNALEALVNEPATLVFYEAPHRVLASLQDMAAVFGGERLAAMARELTKTFETVRRAPLDELVALVSTDSNQQRGELVLLVAGSCAAPAAEVDAEAERLLRLLAAQLPPRKAAAIVAQFTGLRKKALYELLVSG